MVRFKKYIEKDILLENARNADKVKTFGITPRYVPDTPDEFEEFEFVTDFDGRSVSIGVSVQSGKIKRILVGLIDPADPDSFMALSKPQLEEFLNQKGEKLVLFFDYVTR
jgi:hypothetical protein